MLMMKMMLSWFVSMHAQLQLISPCRFVKVRDEPKRIQYARKNHQPLAGPYILPTMKFKKNEA